MPAKRPGAPGFSRATLAFLRDLERHNRRPWFERNRARYEAHVRDAAVQFVRDFEPYLRKLSPHFVADPRPVGGSVMRIHRDLRFSKDKKPYRTSVGIHFWHGACREDEEAPGWYVRIAPRDSFAGGGLWQPGTATLAKVRRAIDQDRDGWRRVLRSGVALQGEALKRLPKGYPEDHPFADDLRRKQFLFGTRIPDAQVASPSFPERCLEAFHEGLPLMGFLTRAGGLPF